MKTVFATLAFFVSLGCAVAFIASQGAFAG